MDLGFFVLLGSPRPRPDRPNTLCPLPGALMDGNVVMIGVGGRRRGGPCAGTWGGGGGGEDGSWD